MTTAAVAGGRAVWAPLALGFRPFYLAGAVSAAGLLPVWLAAFFGLADMRAGDPLAWHVHEMIFGYAAAIIAGFLLTAVRNWTGRETLRGGGLAGLVALWLAGRILPFLAPGWAAAIVDLAFLPAIAIAITRPILAMKLRAGGRRPWLPVIILLVLAAANLTLHLEQLGLWTGGRLFGQSLALGAIAVLIAAIAGRVVPSFTMTAVKVVVPPAPWRDRAALTVLIVAVVVDVLSTQMPLSGWCLATANGVAAFVHAARLQQWRSLRALRVPLLAILHIAYAWLPLALALRALSALGFVSPTLAVHALTVGAMSGLMLAMMTRSALGHTGRPLKAGRVEVAIYAAITMAAVLRLCAAIHPAFQLSLLVGAGLAWEAAFVLFLVRYTPVLLRSRADGLPG